MFDRQFFSTILPEHVRTEVSANDGKIPVIELYLVGGAVLDLCHVVRLADTWVAVAHFCREDVFDDVDIAFIPYGTIVRVSLSMRDTKDRDIGFTMTPPPLVTATSTSAIPATAAPAIAVPVAGSKSGPTE